MRIKMSGAMHVGSKWKEKVYQVIRVGKLMREWYLNIIIYLAMIVLFVILSSKCFLLYLDSRVNRRLNEHSLIKMLQCNV